ncbi:MAG: hypothetical protein J0I16_15900 [Rhizobiales bacterium]|nr:hypothetical protein [Hyphomicrobiales bacterium]
MADEMEILEDESPIPSTEEESALADKLATLKERCGKANIEFAVHSNEDGTLYATIFMPAGRAKRKLNVFRENRATSLLSIPFEKYRFLSGYEAICCYEESYIEAGLENSRFFPQNNLHRLLEWNTAETSSGLKAIQLLPSEALPGRPLIELGPCSPEFIALGGGRSFMTPIGGRPRMTLKLKGIKATQHDQALAELRSYADSLFFQIDMIYGFTFMLERESRLRYLSRRQREAGLQLGYPTARYNSEAMSLYWYAKTARDMPLLRFLAFYQSIEFYFPRYSQTEARKRLSAMIKNPAFRPYRDDDLDRLISTIRGGENGGAGSERTQLRAVINECISVNDTREYLMSSTDREGHYSGKASKTKYHKIPIANKNADLRNDVADRIYDIRCKIVHTKNEHADGEFPMILPFSEDADYLLHDIDLVEFVARSVLVASSDELN